MMNIGKTTMQSLHKLLNKEIRERFLYLGDDSRAYTRLQKDYTLSLIDTYGVRGVSRILQIPRRTIQRWCQQYQKRVDRCPPWVQDWAERRHKRREFWERQGYS